MDDFNSFIKLNKIHLDLFLILKLVILGMFYYKKYVKYNFHLSIREYVFIIISCDKISICDFQVFTPYIIFCQIEIIKSK